MFPTAIPDKEIPRASGRNRSKYTLITTTADAYAKPEPRPINEFNQGQKLKFNCISKSLKKESVNNGTRCYKLNFVSNVMIFFFQLNICSSFMYDLRYLLKI